MPRRNKKSSDSHDEDPGREMRRKKLSLFIQQFEKEANERLSSLEAKTENMLAAVDKCFRVELMKMPPAVKNMTMGDLLSQQEMQASDVSIALKSEAIEMQLPQKRVASKRSKSTDSPPVQATPMAKGSAPKAVRSTRARTRTLTGSTSAGNLRTAPVPVKRSESMKTSNHSATNKPKLRSVVSTGDLQCSMMGAAAHISVTTREGRTFSFSEETKDHDVNLDELDDLAWSQIQRLTTLMDHLSSRCQK